MRNPVFFVRSRFFVALFVAFTALGLPARSAHAAPRGRTGTGPRDRSTELIVRFRSESRPHAISGVLENMRLTKLGRIGSGDALLIRARNIAERDAAIAALRGDQSVLWAQANETRSTCAIPNDPQFGQAWHLDNLGQNGGTPDADIDATEAWDINAGAADIVVAVVDTGVEMPTTLWPQFGHPDLEGRQWVNDAEAAGLPGVDDDGNGLVDDVYGWNFALGWNFILDDNGHGTHVAGIVAASRDNAEGSCGVAPGVRIMSVPGLDDEGSGYDSDLAAAICYAVDMGAKVINASWGGPGESPVIEDAIDYAGEHGVLFVCAAGNSTSDDDTTFFTPASYRKSNLIAVASTTRADVLSGFSSFGAETVHVGAPGSSIYSTYPPYTGASYTLMSGTSTASPMVAGAAALVLSARPELGPADMKGVLMASSDPIPALAGKTVSGGRLNARGALDQALALPLPEPPAIEPEPTPDPVPEPLPEPSRVVIEPVADQVIAEGQELVLPVLAADALGSEPVFVSSTGLPDQAVYIDDLVGGWIFLKPDYTLVQNQDAADFRVQIKAELHSGESATTGFLLRILNDTSIAVQLGDIEDYLRGIVDRLNALAADYDGLAVRWEEKGAGYDQEATAWRDLATSFPQFAERIEAIAVKFDELGDWSRSVSEAYRYFAGYLREVAAEYQGVATFIADLRKLYL